MRRTAAFLILLPMGAAGPDLEWSTYLGGAERGAAEWANAVASDAAGNVYVAGATNSPDFPIVGGFNSTSNGVMAFVAKFDAAGALVWSTFIGHGFASGIAVNAAGQVYVVGTASSSLFPVLHAFDAVSEGQEAFVCKIAADGSALLWSSYLGGSGIENGRAVALDAAGRVYVAGETTSSGLATPGAFQETHGEGGFDAFVARIDGDGPSLDWLTYLGGSGDDRAAGVAVGASGEVYACGTTGSADFPVGGGFDSSHGGGFWDGFVARIAADGASLPWSSFLGGIGSDFANAIALDPSGHACVVGTAGSPDFPIVGGFKTVRTDIDAFVMKVRPDGAILWSSFLGGSGTDFANAVAADAAGHVHVSGMLSQSTDFATPNGFDPTYGGGTTDGFAAIVDASGASLRVASFAGGSADDSAFGVAVDPAGNTIVVGETWSADFPVSGAHDGALAGSRDAFVLKAGSTPVVAIAAPSAAAQVYVTASPAALGGTAVDAHGIASVAWSNGLTSGAGTAVGAENWTADVPLAPGANPITVTATDPFGNTGSDAITVVLDTGPPGVEITSPTAAAAYVTGSTPLALGGVASDDTGIAGVAWSSGVGGGTASGTTAWTIQVPLEAGLNVIQVTATDLAGRTGSDTITVTYDATVPSVAIASPTTGPSWRTGAAAIPLGGTASDDEAVTSVVWTNATTGTSGVASGTTAWTATVPLAAGANVIVVEARDAAMNAGTDTLTVTYEPAGRAGYCGALGVEAVAGLLLLGIARGRRK